MSGLLSAAGHLMSGKSEARQLRFNAEQAAREAEARRAEAAVEASQAAEDAERTIGAAIASAGASGFTLSGSAADVLGDLAGQRSTDIRTILTQGEVDRRERLLEASRLRKNANAAKRISYVRAGADILDFASSRDKDKGAG